LFCFGIDLFAIAVITFKHMYVAAGEKLQEQELSMSRSAQACGREWTPVKSSGWH
jgi:hypothetical protein